MKRKKMLKVCGLLLAVPFVLTGCATVSNVIDRESGKSVYFEDITYFGGNAAKVGDYLYYANGYTAMSEDSTESDYNTGAETGYLARLNLQNGLNANSNQEAPEGIEKVNKRLAGFDVQYMFAYQNYLYFTTPNDEKTTSLEHDYSRVSVCRIKFNGSSFDKLFTIKYSDTAFIKAVEGSDGNAYIVTYAETDSVDSDRDGDYDISVLKIGDKLDKKKREIVVEGATSAVVEEECSNQSIFYTISSELGQTTTEVYSYEIATKQTSQYSVSFGTTTTLISKINDELFYSYTNNGNAVYKTNVSGGDKILGYENDRFISLDSISNVFAVGGNSYYKGYVFVGSSNLMYKQDSKADPVSILSSENFENILFVDGDYVYYSTSTTIGRVSFVPNKGEYVNQTLTTMTKIISGKYAFVDGYIYFYAQYEPLVKEEGDDDFVEYETDESIYMYRIQAGSPEHIGPYELVGKNKEMPIAESTED